MASINRRRFLAAAATGPFVRTSAAPVQPNLMFMVGDDHSYLDAGCAGSKQVATPNIDRIASEGVRFTRAFTGTAMCAPMRQQMFTGIFPVRNGAYPNHSRIRPGIKTWPSHFRDLGYRVALLGKRHFLPLDSYPFEFLDEGNSDALNTAALEEFIQRDQKSPYCVFVTSHQPHAPHTMGDPSRHPASSMRVPSYWVDTPQTRANLSKYYAEVEYLDGEVGRCLSILDRAGRANTITVYCSEQGIGMPFSKWTCYDLGLRENFCVRWPGRIKPRTVASAMVQGVDWLPTLLEAAGGRAPDGIDGRSFLPVLLGESDTHARAVYGVHTTRGIINGSDCYPIRSIRTERHKLILNLNHSTEFQCIIMNEKDGYWDSWLEAAKRDARAAQVVDRYTTRPAVELYDIIEDPHELNNLAGQPGKARLVDSMSSHLLAWMDQQGDRGIDTEMLVPAYRPLVAE